MEKIGNFADQLGISRVEETDLLPHYPDILEEARRMHEKEFNETVSLVGKREITFDEARERNEARARRVVATYKEILKERGLLPL